MKPILPVIITLLTISSVFGQSQAPKPSLIEWHSRYNIERVAFSADGNYLLTLGDDNSVVISDLKKRLPLKKIEKADDWTLLADPSAPAFYTVVKGGDSLSILKRGIPEGNLLGNTRLPLSFGQGWRFQYPELVEIAFDGKDYLAPYDSSGFRAVAVFSSKGELKEMIRMPGAYPVNAITLHRGIAWASTAKGLYRQEGNQFVQALSATGAERFANFQLRGNMIVLLSEENITWYNIADGKVQRKSIKGFFATEAMDSRARALGFHHPFAVDAGLAAWVTNTSMFQLNRTVTSRPYAVAKVTPASIEYPLMGDVKDSREKLPVEPELAYNEKAGILAIVKDSWEVMICHPDHNRLFSLERKNLPVQSLYFTSTPGKILVQTDDMQSPGFFLNLSNGRMETIGVMDDLYYRKRQLTAEAVPTGAVERLWSASQQRFYPATYWNFKDQPFLRYPFRDIVFPAIDGNQLLELDDAGLLTLKERNGKQLKQLQLFGLVNEDFGIAVNANKLELPATRKVAFNSGHRLRSYQYDSASAVLVIELVETGTSNENTIHVIDLKKFQFLRSYASDHFKVIPSSGELVTGLGVFRLSDHSALSLFPAAMRDAREFTLSSDKKQLYFYVNGYEAGDRFYRWDFAAQKLYELGRQQGINLIAADPHSSLAYTRGLDNSIRVWNEAGELATIVFSGQKDYNELREVDGSSLVLLKDGFYMGENKYYQLLNLHDGQRTYSIADVDVLYHRPDKVLRALGYAPSTTIEPLRQQADTRASRSRLKMVEADISIAAPEKIPYHSNGKLNLAATLPQGKNYKGVMVYVNGTAITNKPQAVSAGGRFNGDIELVDAVNHIRLALVDSEGKETPGDYIYVNSKPAEGADVFLVGIGVSEYRDSKYNLKYAAKDMNDLLNYFSLTDTYSKVHMTRFSNGQVTKQVVDSIGRLLHKAKSNDVVICYFAGHGMLDSRNEYFLATHDMNFEDPSQAGIHISQLNEAVASSPARKKMIFIDACHSGLLDDLGTVTDTISGNEEEQQGVVKRGLVIRKQQKASALRYSFSHFNQGTGVDILAASAGNEFALELGSIRNGVFTYSMLKAMKSGEADFNNDGQLTLNELQLYVSELTRKLTKGAQRPSFRQNNMYQDIRLLSSGDSYLARFMDAAKYNHTETLKLLLDNREVEVDQKNKEGFTALAYASREGSFNAAKLLVENGADVKLKTDFGFSPLYLAAWNGHYRIAYYLLTKGASVATDMHQWQIDSIRSKNDPRVVQVLDQYDRLKTSQDLHFQFAMHLVRGETRQADSMMQTHRLDINTRLLVEGIPMVVAPVLGKNTEALKWVLDKGADINLASLDDGYTALMFAANQGSSELVELLLSRGADKTSKDRQGRTAADYARQAGFTSLAERLK